MSTAPASRALPTVVLTGASGYIGRHVLDRLLRDHLVYALARRSRRDAGVAEHHHLHWIVVDLCDEERLAEACAQIAAAGGADFVMHLAGYYDFRNVACTEYELSNVRTTRNMLEQSRRLGIRRFVLASSLVVSEFPRQSGPITETTPGDATFPYARSKQRAERLVRESARLFPCSIVRLAATYSDWCEYPPLYMLLNHWLSGVPISRILAGRGAAAIPYIHVRCVVRTLMRILERSDALADLDTYIASRACSHSQHELFRLVTRLHDGVAARPLFVPRAVVAAGIAARRLIGRVRGRSPMERLWMMRYVDRRLEVDPSYTRRELQLSFRPRMLIERRMAYLVENLRSFPLEWRVRNARRLVSTREHLNLVLSDLMRARRETIVDGILAALHEPERRQRLPHYVGMDPSTLRWYLEAIYDLLTSSVRTGERRPLLSHVRYIAALRQREGLPAEEVQEALRATGEVVIDALAEVRKLDRDRRFLGNSIRLALEMAVDEVEEVYEGPILAEEGENGDPLDLDAPSPTLR